MMWVLGGVESEALVCSVAVSDMRVLLNAAFHLFATAVQPASRSDWMVAV